MKMFMVIYSEAADDYVLKKLKETGLVCYTKVDRAVGVGTETEPKLKSHTWPGQNHLMFMCVEDSDAPKALTMFAELKKEHPRAGVKTFVLPVEEVM